MNAVEIEGAISALATAKFPFAFLGAFGNKPTTIKRRSSETVMPPYLAFHL
jgi:hypothetical protein